MMPGQGQGLLSFVHISKIKVRPKGLCKNLSQGSISRAERSKIHASLSQIHAVHL